MGSRLADQLQMAGPLEDHHEIRATKLEVSNSSPLCDIAPTSPVITTEDTSASPMGVSSTMSSRVWTNRKMEGTGPDLEHPAAQCLFESLARSLQIDCQPHQTQIFALYLSAAQERVTGDHGLNVMWHNWISTSIEEAPSHPG